MPNLRFVRLILSGLATLYTCSLVAGAIRGPILAFVFDRQVRGIRPILGIPGASTQAEPLRLDASLSNAVIANTQDYALGVVEKSNELIQISGLSGSVSSRMLAPGPQAIDLVVLSPSATAAAVHHSGTKTVQIISGLPSRPSAGKELDISTLPDSPGSLAVSDDARFLVAVVNRRDSGEIFLIDADGNTRQVFTGVHLSAVAFMGATHDLLVADDINDSIHVVYAVDSSAASVAVAGRQDGVLGPVAAGASPDRRHIFIVNARPASVIVLDVSNHSTAKYVCHCAPAGFTPLIGRATFMFSQPVNGPLWVFDGDAEQPRVVFVPSPRPRQAAARDAAQ
jgi:hypothetical protein